MPDVLGKRCDDDANEVDGSGTTVLEARRRRHGKQTLSDDVPCLLLFCSAWRALRRSLSVWYPIGGLRRGQGLLCLMASPISVVSGVITMECLNNFSSIEKTSLHPPLWQHSDLLATLVRSSVASVEQSAMWGLLMVALWPVLFVLE